MPSTGVRGSGPIDPCSLNAIGTAVGGRLLCQHAKPFALAAAPEAVVASRWPGSERIDARTRDRRIVSRHMRAQEPATEGRATTPTCSGADHTIQGHAVIDGRARVRSLLNLSPVHAPAQ